MGATGELDALPGWVTLVRAPNPGPMTLDGTNTWVLRAPGATHATVVDPGPLDDGHLRRVAALGPVRRIVLTHGHPDHADGAARLAALAGGAPVHAADPAHGAPPGDGFAGDGLTVTVLPTPGHTADSLCLLAETAGERVVCTGDTLLGRGTTVVAWPDGDLGAYLDSLRLLTGYPLPALPGHGPARADCAATARAYLAHRTERLDQVRAAVAAGADTPEAVVDAVYPGVDPGVRFAAEWSARAQLAYLRRESPAGARGLDPL